MGSLDSEVGMCAEQVTPECKPGTHCFPPQNCTVLRDSLIVLVRKCHGQEEGALLCIISNVILMDWRRDDWFLRSAVASAHMSSHPKAGVGRH